MLLSTYLLALNVHIYATMQSYDPKVQPTYSYSPVLYKLRIEYVKRKKSMKNLHHANSNLSNKSFSLQ